MEDDVKNRTVCGRKINSHTAATLDNGRKPETKKKIRWLMTWRKRNQSGMRACSLRTAKCSYESMSIKDAPQP